MQALAPVKPFSWCSSTSTSHFFSCVLFCTRVALKHSYLRSMGNRPQGTKFSYTATAIFFALLMVYMLFFSVWLTIKGVQASLPNLKQSRETFGRNFGETVSAIFGDRIFRDLIFSTGATYGLYLVSSILFLDFLHMFTSFSNTSFSRHHT